MTGPGSSITVAACASASGRSPSCGHGVRSVVVLPAGASNEIGHRLPALEDADMDFGPDRSERPVGAVTITRVAPAPGR